MKRFWLVGLLLVVLSFAFVQEIRAYQVPNLRLPFDSSLSGQIRFSSGPHAPSSTNTQAVVSVHIASGIDFAGGNNWDVRSMSSGWVTFVGLSDSSLGNIVVIKNEGFDSYLVYSHLSSLSDEIRNEYQWGDSYIDRGTKLGVVGGSGVGGTQQWPIHLHVDLRAWDWCTQFCLTGRDIMGIQRSQIVGNPLSWWGQQVDDYTLYPYCTTSECNQIYNYDGIALKHFWGAGPAFWYGGFRYQDTKEGASPINREGVYIAGVPTGYCTSGLINCEQNNLIDANIRDYVVFSGKGTFGSGGLLISTNTQPNNPQPTVESGPVSPNWLLEFSKAERPPLEVDIHTHVDAVSGYSAHRVLVDGQNIGETSANEQYITWNTFGWTDGYHTLRVEYRRVGDNGNWATALSHEEQFYLSPNRNGSAPCDGRDGAELVSDDDCIILTQTFPALDQIGWNDRSNLVVTARGYDVWLEYEWTPVVIPVGQTMSVGSNISSVELRTPAPPPPPLPQSAFTVDQHTRYLFPFNEGSGASTIDIVSGLVGTMGSGSSWIPGRFGNALLFPNPNDGRGVTTAPFEVCPLTVELWARINNDSQGRLAGQIGSNNNGGPNKWILAVSDRRPKFEVWSLTGSQWITSAVEMQHGTWHYIMATYNCSTRDAKLYLDNQLVGQFVSNNPWGSGPTTFEIGAVEGIYRCACEIDDVRISNTIRIPSIEPTATPTITPSATYSPTPTLIPTNEPQGSDTWIAEYRNLVCDGDFPPENLTWAPDFVQQELEINHNWSGGSPNFGIGDDCFAVTWTKDVDFDGGWYRFMTWSDDGARVFVDNSLVLSAWYDHGGQDDDIVVEVSAGTHEVRVEYYEHGGGAEIWFGIEPAAVEVTAIFTPTPLPISTATATEVYTQTSTEVPPMTPEPSSIELIPSEDPLVMQADSESSMDAIVDFDSNVLVGKTVVRITVNLHGLDPMEGDASAFFFVQEGEWRYVALASYVNGNFDGSQIVDIPLSDFWDNQGEQQLDTNAPIEGIGSRFWYASAYLVEITSIVVS